MKNKKIIIGVVAVVIAVGIFYGGVSYGKAHPVARQFNANGQSRGNAQFSGRGMGGNRAGFLAGEILSKDDKSFTVKLQDGGSKIVFLSASTTVAKSASGSLVDIVQGGSVMVQGQANPDGSLTAQSVQIRPTR
jgi:hypothetical protein